MFMVFTGYSYYPYGGWGDFRGFAPTEEAAKELAKAQEEHDWYQVVSGSVMIMEGRISELK